MPFFLFFNFLFAFALHCVGIVGRVLYVALLYEHQTIQHTPPIESNDCVIVNTEFGSECFGWKNGHFPILRCAYTLFPCKANHYTFRRHMNNIYGCPGAAAPSTISHTAEQKICQSDPKTTMFGFKGLLLYYYTPCIMLMWMSCRVYPIAHPYTTIMPRIHATHNTTCISVPVHIGLGTTSNILYRCVWCLWMPCVHAISMYAQLYDECLL